ncbi:M24 family metallopeptidase [Undibacterium fentianense]|uniref:Aminopeptidase P family protein n=1 Tax=Undibacterium fentianense TaxID=2828728 RepID=A0A941IBL4_9BURK|nr:Xaa-Pro peptidase family protein [Undibacterium fentianense]MBR7799189.1 aminopeptidase P family protein [Undibacterium fentianense]
MNSTIGGSSAERELASITRDLSHVRLITDDERQQRRDKAAVLMQERGIAALILSASTSLYYFTGLSWYQSERLVGAVLTCNGKLIFISPAFEESKLRETLGNQADIRLWEEDESPYTLVAQVLRDVALSGTIALDEAAPFFIADGLRQALSAYTIVNGMVITAECRMHKSANEIALMQAAKNITLEVQRRTAKILREGISSTEVAEFINQAHRAFGGSSSTFCIVSFGLPTSIPHGPDGVQYLKDGDMVLIDTGCMIERYHSDITRSYVFGEPTERQRTMWELEKAAQAAAFEAAQIGVPCEEVDAAARRILEAAGLGPGYKTPGLPHRTGHGIGLDIHEWTYLVKGNKTPLAAGMCFSNEPMICLDGEFGIRLEDHFYMTEQGPRWFTGQSHAVDAPFGK